MPSAELLKQKEQFVKELSEKLKNSAAGVLVDYKGITVADDTKLRKEFRRSRRRVYGYQKHDAALCCKRGGS